MKKVNMSVKAQERRRAALARFTISKQRAKDDPYYAARKAQELAALEDRVGAH
jgi:hypothetical protein